jgi:hypothetical protein
MSKRASAWIPQNVLAAAKRAGLTTLLWYVGRSRGPAAPRKKTLQDLEREAESRWNDEAPAEARASDA